MPLSASSQIESQLYVVPKPGERLLGLRHGSYHMEGIAKARRYR